MAAAEIDIVRELQEISGRLQRVEAAVRALTAH
jgi:hypothetical protein